MIRRQRLPKIIIKSKASICIRNFSNRDRRTRQWPHNDVVRLGYPVVSAENWSGRQRLKWRVTNEDRKMAVAAIENTARISYGDAMPADACYI